MMINLSYSELRLLNHVLTTTGEMEMGQDGKEVLAPLKLNGEESSQRRHFVKAMKEVTTPIETKLKELSEAHNAIVKEVRDEYQAKNPAKAEATEEEKAAAKKKEDDEVVKDERLKESIEKTNEEIKNLMDGWHEVTVADKVWSVVKKYLTLYGDTTGFAVGDDETVGHLEELFADVKAAK